MKGDMVGTSVFEVNMLNGFSIKYGEIPIDLGHAMENKAIMLLQYLLYHHDQKMSSEKIYNDLYSMQDSLDPPHLVRINVYRLKKILGETSLPQDIDYITRDGRLYHWTDKVCCITDVDKFAEAASGISRQEASQQERLESCRKALSLFAGELLPNRSVARWMSVERAKLKSIYIKCLEYLSENCKTDEGADEVLYFCNRALQIYPYDEELHILKMSCLFDLKRFSDAIAAFNAANSTIYSQLGVPPSKKLLSMYSQLSRNAVAPKANIEEISSQLGEEDAASGTYHINYLTFMEAYRIITRTVERSGQSVFLMLLELDFDEREQGDRSDSAIEALHNAIVKSLRRGDIFTRYSSTQFLILLLGINEENCGLVYKRMLKNWKNEWNGRGIQLTYRAISSVDAWHEAGGNGWD